MKVILAPDSFKESLSAVDAAAAMARGVRRVWPDAVIEEIPLADGGEGIVEALVTATGGAFRQTQVVGPRGGQVTARWGLLGNTDSTTAVIEMAAASGLALLPNEQRNPLETTTYGTGQLVGAALDAGAKKIIIGIGGSATNDGGTGAAQAVGVRFYDRDGNILTEPLTGGRLDRIEQIDLNGRDPRLKDVDICAACDVTNPLCGPRGAAAVYAPQKGATPGQVDLLDNYLAHLAERIIHNLNKTICDVPGAGAAGGMGGGLLAFFNARLRSGIDLVLDAVRFEQRIADADLILTGEGRLDAQSVMGKVIAGVARVAARHRVPVIALAGLLGDGVEQTRELLHSYHCINPPDLPLDQAFARAAQNLERTAADICTNWPAG